MSSIGRLTRTDTISAGDVLPAYVQSQGDARGLAISVLQAYLQGALTFPSTGIQSYETRYAAPSSTGFTVQIGDTTDNTHLILTPTASFASGTIVLPASGLSGVSIDKQQIMVNTTQSVTSLTIDGNGANAVTGAPSSMLANDSFILKYDLPSGTWYQVSLSTAASFAAGISSFLNNPTSANLLNAITNETGTGPLVFGDSPTLTGTPSAPTAAPGTSTAQLSTTEFVQTALTNLDAYRKSNILGTVSQSAGVPTGAIFEVGGTLNGTGKYFKYADGSAKILKRLTIGSGSTTASGNIFRSTATSAGAFPFSFVGDVPVVHVSGSDSAGGGWAATDTFATLTDWGTFSTRSSVSQGVSCTIYLSAEGRWF